MVILLIDSDISDSQPRKSLKRSAASKLTKHGQEFTIYIYVNDNTNLLKTSLFFHQQQQHSTGRRASMC